MSKGENGIVNLSKAIPIQSSKREGMATADRNPLSFAKNCNKVRQRVSGRLFPLALCSFRPQHPAQDEEHKGKSDGSHDIPNI